MSSRESTFIDLWAPIPGSGIYRPITMDPTWEQIWYAFARRVISSGLLQSEYTHCDIPSYFCYGLSRRAVDAS